MGELPFSRALSRPPSAEIGAKLLFNRRGRFPKKGLAFRSKRSMYVVIARVTLSRAIMRRPDVLNRPGLVSILGIGLGERR
jgi:hypothetical protein